jgi:5-hydroxyisourate hydrolase
MSAITTHVLDTARGSPAAGVPVALDMRGTDDRWLQVGRGTTDQDGRLRTLMQPDAALVPGIYRLVFETNTYFDSLQIRAFYPVVVVTFQVVEGETHYHVPLLLSPFGYSTYRGT